ncbi:hypothetical protein LTR08_005646 [Meristemomyces frigidus]|nr:hypothetical protein LTR08_005646 [Meristemomyces frigidus]
MHLFVLGPAFGLPSIDAECNAAVALLKLRLGEQGWQLTPTAHDQNRLPLLLDGHKRFSGFASIARHLDDVAATPPASAKQQADSIAIGSFLEANAQTLLDISLYASSENYSTTRSAFTRILPWHANYLLPPKYRAAARARTEHLGISSIDVDNVHGNEGVGKEQQGFEVETQKRASLLLPRKDTLRSLLGRPENVATFKLHALAENFFAPLQDMLGDCAYFGGSEPTSVDCLAYGYLSLMLYPLLPQDWLASTLRRKYKKLVAFTQRVHQDLQTSVDDVMSLSKCATETDVAGRRKSCNMALPWTPPATSFFLDVAKTTARELMSYVPALRASATVITAKAAKATFWQQYLPALLGVTATTLGLSIYFALRTDMLVWPHGEELHIFGRKRFSDYGHLGAALAGVSLLGQQSNQDATAYEQPESPVSVGITVEGDGLP